LHSFVFPSLGTTLGRRARNHLHLRLLCPLTGRLYHHSSRLCTPVFEPAKCSLTWQR
jgi:hypothetical protein